MQELAEFHKFIIGRVAVAYWLSSPDLDPVNVTSSIGVEPTLTVKKGDDILSPFGKIVGQQREGRWCLSSNGFIESKDVNDHFGYLFEELLPHRDRILELVAGASAESYFDVLWESSYLYAGTGPVLSRESIERISLLAASVGFDIYQIDRPA